MVVSHQGRGYLHENILEDGLIVWDQEFLNRLYLCKMDDYEARGRGRKIDMKVVGKCHSTDQNGIQKSRLI